MQLMPGSSRSILAWCLLWAVFAALTQDCGSFKYVYIPCDSSRPMEEWCLEPRREDLIGCMTDHLQGWFGKAGELSPTAMKEFREHVRMNIKEKGMGPEAEAAVDTENFDQTIGSTETVEIVTLLPPSSDNGYVTVSMYIDDRGIARQLPRNERATNLMHTVSNRAGSILGDAFLGRAYDNEDDDFERLDLRVTDVSSNAGWVKLCAEHKEQSERNRGRVEATMQAFKDKKTLPESTAEATARERHEAERKELEETQNDEKDPLLRDGFPSFPAKMRPALETERACVEAAAALRERGNLEFNNGNLALAIRKYHKARRYILHCAHLSLDAPESVSESERKRLLSACEMNLALSYFKHKALHTSAHWARALLAREPTNVKAMYRLACALRDAGNVPAATETLSKALHLAPEDKALARALGDCRARERREEQATAAMAKNMFGKGFGNLYPEAPKPAKQDAMEDGNGGGADGMDVDAGADAARNAKAEEEELDDLERMLPPGAENDAELEKALRAYGKASGERGEASEEVALPSRVL